MQMVSVQKFPELLPGLIVFAKAQIIYLFPYYFTWSIPADI